MGRSSFFPIVATMLAAPAVAGTPNSAGPAQESPGPPPPAVKARALPSANPLFEDEDYPVEAYRAGQSGQVAFSALVGVDGLITACEITESSGYPLLDEATCRLVTLRARFTPARDRDGRPTIDRVSARITWRLPH